MDMGLSCVTINLSCLHPYINPLIQHIHPANRVQQRLEPIHHLGVIPSEDGAPSHLASIKLHFTLT